MPTITTSTAATATAYSNQRKIDRTSNGVLWMIYWDGTNNTTTSMRSRYSTDNGVTWIDPGTGSAFGFAGSAPNFTPDSSLFIDKDDYAHVVYKDAGDGYIRYRRGTPNAGRTAWTWTTAYTVGWATTNQCDYPDVIAHQEGTGWVVHCVHSFNNGSFNNAEYRRVTISSSQVITVVGTEPTAISGSYGVNSHVFPSIDFNHTGDGKTVAGGTPHLYVAWSAGATGAGKGIRFKKATYSAGTWTWGTEREIDSNHYNGGSFNWLNGAFDGTRFVMAGFVAGTDGIADLVLHERDASDTTTVARTLLDSPANSDNLAHGSMTYDGDGNVYLLGRDLSGANGTRLLKWRKWTRSNTTLGVATTFDSTGADNPYVSAKRGYSNNRIEFIYTDGTASPYNVTYDSIILNNPPTITITTPTENQKLDPRVVSNVAWTYSDVEGNPQASWTADVRTPAPAPSSYAGGAAAQTGTIQTFTVPTTGTYTIEAIGAAGGQSSESYSGGAGAKIVGKFNLTAGQELKVIAGKPGNKPTNGSRGGSGGGASWVYIQGAANPMIVAGGGGGAGNYAYDATVQDASITTAGKSGATTPNGYGAGGTGGNGGSAGSYASGGAGWVTNGTDNGSGYSTGGKTPANGATGGNGQTPPTEGQHGGFGGGGGSYAGAGGGGGYSGGGAGGWSNSGHGGGGGSYNAGTNQVNTAGVGTDSGSVTISLDSVVVFSTSGTTATNFNIPANSMADETNYEINLSVSDGISATAVKRNIVSDSWNYNTEVVTATQSGNLDASTFQHGGSYQIQVATSDTEGYGPYSSSATYVNDNLPETEIVPPSIFGVTQGTVQYTYSDKDGDAPTKFQVRYRKKI